MISAWLKTPIPNNVGTTHGWESVPIYKSTDPLVAIGTLSDYPQLFTNAVYAGEREDSPYRGLYALPHATKVICVRKSVADKLVRAQELLPPGKLLIIYDGYRSLDVQKSLYDHYYSELQRFFPDQTSEWLQQETERYVTLPSEDSAHPAPHTTGGAVDVAIISVDDENYQKRQDLLIQPKSEARDTAIANLISSTARLEDFGAPFDHGDAEASLAYYESSDGFENARDNRRLLYHLMTHVGFAPFASEWWHFNAPETQMGACTLKSESASFGSIDLPPEIQKLEELRTQLPISKQSNLPKIPVIEPSDHHKLM